MLVSNVSENTRENKKNISKTTHGVIRPLSAFMIVYVMSAFMYIHDSIFYSILLLIIIVNPEENTFLTCW